MRSASEQNARTTETGVFEEERQDGVDDEYGGKAARKCLGALNIDEKLFEDGIYGSSFMGDNAKPMPEAFEMVCEDIGVSPKECVRFEDSFKNLKTCVNLGMGGVFVAGETLEMELGGGGEKNEEKSDKGELNAVANVVVESIGDLFEVCPELFD